MFCDNCGYFMGDAKVCPVCGKLNYTVQTPETQKEQLSDNVQINNSQINNSQIDSVKIDNRQVGNEPRSGSVVSNVKNIEMYNEDFNRASYTMDNNMNYNRINDTNYSQKNSINYGQTDNTNYSQLNNINYGQSDNTNYGQMNYKVYNQMNNMSSHITNKMNYNNISNDASNGTNNLQSPAFNQINKTANHTEKNKKSSRYFECCFYDSWIYYRGTSSFVCDKRYCRWN